MGRFVFENFDYVGVQDGDTLNLIVDVGFYLHRQRSPAKKGEPPRPLGYRLRRINAPELKTDEGKVAAARLRELVLDQTLRIETFQDPEKYGRYLVEVEVFIGDNWVNVNDLMVAGGYASYKDY